MVAENNKKTNDEERTKSLEIIKVDEKEEKVVKPSDKKRKSLEIIKLRVPFDAKTREETEARRKRKQEDTNVQGKRRWEDYKIEIKHCQEKKDLLKRREKEDREVMKKRRVEDEEFLRMKREESAAALARFTLLPDDVKMMVLLHFPPTTLLALQLPAYLLKGVLLPEVSRGEGSRGEGRPRAGWVAKLRCSGFRWANLKELQQLAEQAGLKVPQCPNAAHPFLKPFHTCSPYCYSRWVDNSAL